MLWRLTPRDWHVSPCIELITQSCVCCLPVVGASVDPAGVTMVDSIKVYTKTKEAFGWPEDNEEFPEASTTPKTPTTLTANGMTPEADSAVTIPVPPNSVDK